MSNRDSMGFGDLLPQDVVEVFAQEKHSKRGRKKRRRTLGRAFSWLKGKKRKNLSANGQGLDLGPAPNLDLDGRPTKHQGGYKGGQKSGRQAHPQANSHAVPKGVDDDKTPAHPLLQENVFIESSRPKYLEDLHTEAREGLKMMQQEETNNGVEYRDNESTISSVTVQTDGEGGGFVTDSTIADSSSVVSMQSSVSTRSSRSGLTRQGSTFRPLNSGKKSKARTGRRHRKTVVGIPKHVQKELGLDRAAWTLTQRLDEEQFYRSETVTTPTSDGPQYAAESAKEAGASLQATNIIMPLSKDRLKLLGATHAGHRDDLALLHRLGPHLEGGHRPRSLAVPWMTTASSFQQQPPSPVMSMSPQATYLSKIIPNAVLPPSIEVVEISRGRSRSSVRTVSKSSLVLSSPAPSRASSRASSSRTTSSNISSVSRYNIPNVSDSSCWSNSESSETLVSDSSTISSSSTPRQRMSQDEDASAKQGKVISNSSNFTTNGTSNGKLIIKEDKVDKDGQFVRSLSVIKPKRAPPPPSRSYSLHNRMKRRSRDLAEARTSPGESPLHSTSAPSEENEKNKLASSPMPSIRVESPGYHADTSSLEDSTGSVSFSLMKSQLQEPKREDVKNNSETVSTEASHEKQEPLQENKLKKVVSPSSGYSSQDGTSPQVSRQPHSSSPKHKKGFLAKLHMLFHGSTSVPSPHTKPDICEKTEITAGPKPDLVHGVSPSVRTLSELFNIPPPPKVHAPPPPPPEVWAHNKRTFELLLGPPAPDNIQAIIKKNPKDRRQQRLPPSVSTEGSVKSLEVERKHKNPTVTVDTVNGSLIVPPSVKLNGEIHKENTGRLAQNRDLEGNDKDEKVRVCDMLNGMLVKTVEKCEETLVAKRSEEGQNTSTVPTEVNTKIDKSPVASLVRNSPSPSSTLAHHPPQSLTRLTTEAASVTSVQVVSPESSWPLPPPPPMAHGSTNGPDEIDLPLPPPPMFGEEVLVLPAQVPPKQSVLGSDFSCTTVSVKQGRGAESVKVITGAEPQKRCISQEMVPTTLKIPPPPSYTAPLAPKTAVLTPTTEKVSLPLKEVSPPPPPLKPEQSTSLVLQEVLPLVRVVSPSPVTEVTPPLVVEVSPQPSEEASQSAEEAAPESKLMPPQSIPPPPPPLPSQLHPSEQIYPPQENIALEPESYMDSSNNILTPPQSIPPTPPIGPLLQPSELSQTTDYPATDEAPPSPPSEFRNSPSLKDAEEPASLPPISVPLPPPLSVQGHASIKHQSSPLSTENQSQEKISAPVEPAPSITPSLPHVVKLRSVNSSPEPPEAQEQTAAPVAHEEPTPVVTPSLLQMVKLRSVNSSPEPPEAQQQPEPEVTMNQQQPSNQVPTSSYSSDAPQKPIRRSLIMISPTPASPPVVDASQPTLPKSPSVVVTPESSSTSVSPVKKSPPTTTISPSMNLQEAIRLRTAARSKESSASHLSLHSPGFPKSPTSTASFIFSKSNKKVVIETKHVMEDKETKQKNIEVSPETKTISEAESTKKQVKVPPAVAKKPKTKCNGTETSEGVVHTEGQEAEQESIRDAAEETSGTAGAVEGVTSST
ncbi:uncharacterized protein PAE49_019378 [Odontesthes bonariensis]|uniref:uncharacterized protein LOC142402537 n=1 Tax=Odontesthes bonariensis TaxID=219752 RepID=UPI003F58F33B